MTRTQEIAVVGRACRLPGAPSVDDLWQLLASGTCAVTSIPPDRWALERFSHPRVAERGRSYTWAAGCLDDIWGFDPGAFGMSPREAEMIDPQQRLLLELTWEALEDAGIRPSSLAGTDAGVFVGASAVDHSTLRLLDMSSADAYMMTGNTLSIVANRISYIFDLHGPSFVVDTACSSALVALNEAIVNLRSGRIDTAIVAGVGLLAAPHSFVGFAQAAMLSRRGLCQAFAAQADGYVRAEGGVVLVLQTQEAAARDGNPVHALVAAADVNSDGRTNGISLPSKRFQAKLLDQLYRRAGVDPDDLAFFEAHGTGTPVGDPIEAAAIGETIAQRRKTPLLIGSIKTNIGHMEAASGLGGVLKAMLALEHDELPASLHSGELNPHIDFEGLNLRVAQEATPLPKVAGTRRLAGVNSFGFGGTNAHVILADAPDQPAPVVAAAPRFFVVSAHSRSALAALVAQYAARLDAVDEDEARAVMAAAVHKRDLLPHRVVVPVSDGAAVVALLDGLGDDAAEVGGAARGTAIGRDAPVAFVFSGNGSQFAGMGRTAYAHNAIFRAELDEMSAAFERLASWSIVEALHSEDLADKLELTEFAQPLLFAIQSATSVALRAYGLEPQFVIGHSVGEVAAAEAAGLLDRAGALRTIFSRSRHQGLTHGHGDMAVVIGSREATDDMLAELPRLSLAAHNSPRAFTISGPIEDIARLPELARHHPKVRVRKLKLLYPFHSPLMAPVEAPLMRSLARLKHHNGNGVTFISTVTGTALDELDTRYWWRNVREPVLFSTAVAEGMRQGARVFVEIGPTPTLLSHIGDTIDERTATIATLPSLEKRERGYDPIAFAVASAIARGAKIDRAKAFGAPPPAGSRVALPLYPWQRTTYRLPDTSESVSNTLPMRWHPLAGGRYGTDRLEWHSSLDTTRNPTLADHCVDGRAILPGAAFAEMAIAVARDWLGSEAATIADLEITSPMQLTADHGREVLCRLSPLANHVEILSRPRLGQTPWQTHVTAKIVLDPTVDLASAPIEEVRGRSIRTIAGPEIYALAARAGLSYGPAYQKLRTASLVRANRILFELVEGEADPAFGVDPARLDACFHALLLVFVGRDDRGSAGGSAPDPARASAYVPVRFGEIMLRQPGTAFTKGVVDIKRHDERIIVADFKLTDESGDVILFLRDARFQAVRTGASEPAARKAIYQTTVLAAEPTAARNDRPLTLKALRCGISGEPTSAALSEDFVLLEGWATSLALRTVRELVSADIIDVDAIIQSGRLPSSLRRWLEQLVVALERSGLLETTPAGSRIDPDSVLPDPDDILRAIALDLQHLSAELLLAASTTTAIRAILADEHKRPTLSPKVLDAFELGSFQAQGAADYLATLVRASVAKWPTDRAMRILQVGFGPLSRQILTLAERTEARLTIFDPDRRRLERAKLAFTDRGDIEFIDQIDALTEAAFDLVLAADALDRSHRVPRFWAGLRRAMAPSALFAAVEPVPSFFHDLALGLDAGMTEGAGHGFSLHEADWREMMRAASFIDAEVRSVATTAGAAFVLTAEVDAERRSWSGSGTALILGESDTRAMSAFATLLASSGQHVSLHVDEDVEVLTEAPVAAVVFAGTADAECGPVQSLMRQCVGLKRLADVLDKRPTTIWLVTSGAIRPHADRGSDVAAGLWAFSRTLANEAPNLDIRRVDVAGDVRPGVLAERLRDLVLSNTDETEICLDETSTRVVRFAPRSLLEHGHVVRADAGRLVRVAGAGADRLAWRPVQRQAPAANEVEIEVEAIGLNFRDVMFGLGLLPEEILERGFAGPTLGLECAGRVAGVGSAVKKLKPGDRVMAFARHAFSTHVTTKAEVTEPIPETLSFAMAATIPVAFLTAYHALMNCARLKPKEWLLVHGGAGGVGLAAIQIASWRGARIIATAGSPERRALLVALGAEHVFDSRSGAFVENVRRATGDGVDVVLNSLSGEAMERSIGVLRPFGRFVELGKRDYVANTHIGLRPFRRNLSYFGVDLDQLLLDEPKTSRLLMRAVTRLFADGDLAALPYRTFEAGETAEAFRLMQQSGHVGKLVVRPPRVEDIVVRRRHVFVPSADKIHLITGGFGGFGLATAQWLARNGARNIMLVGRNGAPSREADEAISGLEAQGVTIWRETLDVADRSALQPLFARFGRDLPVLGGVIHAAMVLADTLIANLSADKIERVLRPKVAGADLLDQLTQALTLDYFLLYSSATTLIGNPGQAAYVAANGYLEGLARRRRRAGLPALAVAWGAIEDVGVLARSPGTRETLASRVGLKGMMAQDALDQLAQILGTQTDDPDEAVVAIAPLTWSAARQHVPLLKAPAYRRLVEQDEATSNDGEKIDIVKLVADKSPEDARALVGGLIVDEIARVLRLPRDDIARGVPLSDIGLDSLMAVELALGLESRFVLDAPLTATASSFSVNELADHVIGLATGSLSENHALARELVQRHLGEVALAEVIDPGEFQERAEAVHAESQKLKGVLN